MDGSIDPVQLLGPGHLLNLTDFNFGFQQSGSDSQAGMELVVKKYSVQDDSMGNKVVLDNGKTFDFFPQEQDKDYDAAVVITITRGQGHSIMKSEIVIRSPHMRAALKTVIGQYPSMDLHGEKVTIQGPPRCVIQFWPELSKYIETLQDDTAQKHVRYLLDFTRTTFHSDIHHYMNHMGCNTGKPRLDFDNLWMAYRPGDLVFFWSDDKKMVGKLVDMGYDASEMNWTLSLEITVCVEDKPSHSLVSISIARYFGSMAFAELRAFPLKFHPNPNEVINELVERGKRFFGLIGVHQQNYVGIGKWAAGPKDGTKSDNSFTSFRVKSRVMIDPTSFKANRPEHKTKHTQYNYPYSRIQSNTSYEFGNERYLICDYEVFGYSLTDKRWCVFDIDRLTDIQRASTSFENLLLPEEQKKTLLSLVTAHANEDLPFQDLVDGKGKGIILLLHGVPGVGKTLTAESISDYVERPLFAIRSGDLGVDAQTLEKNLTEVLEMASKWNAILLFDEADVFLEARRRNELQRNSLVSIFLRILEYFEGIIFLTTNRIKMFDPAFKSRIHLSIKYRPLSMESRWQLWYNFISTDVKGNRVIHHSVQEEDFLNELARYNLNGRQIRNIIRTAWALAHSENKTIEAHHIQTTLAAMSGFGDAEIEESDVSSSDEGDDQRVCKRRRID